MRNIYKVIVFLFIPLGCAGPNPNPGERTTDRAWLSGNFDYAYELVKPRAEAGQPWAQLRLGIFYENGWVSKKDIEKAEYWYKKTINHKANDDWSNGQMVGATGKAGYFNQNSDALIAEYNLALLYYNNAGDLTKALEHINHVIKESDGKDIFFCCEFAGGRYFSQKQFIQLKEDIHDKIIK